MNASRLLNLAAIFSLDLESQFKEEASKIAKATAEKEKEEKTLKKKSKKK